MGLKDVLKLKSDWRRPAGAPRHMFADVVSEILAALFPAHPSYELLNVGQVHYIIAAAKQAHFGKDQLEGILKPTNVESLSKPAALLKVRDLADVA